MIAGIPGRAGRGALFFLLTATAGMAAPAAGHAQHATSRTDSAPTQPAKHPLTALLMLTGGNILTNRFDAWVLNVHDTIDGYYARVAPRSWSNNIHSGWVWDADNFSINMFGHPYQGGSYFRAGRTNGLTFWESVPLAFVGSAEWEFFGETSKPSLNDLYNTGFGGIIVGEMVYRLVLVIRDNESHGAGRVLRELAAFPLDPYGGLKRLISGDFTRVHANPGEHRPPLLALQVQTGVRQARDSGLTGQTLRKGLFVAELNYGDAFKTPYGRPMDVFQARALVSPGPNPLGELHILGRLYAHEFTNPSAPVRTSFTLRQKFEYTRNPAYKFGGQSVEAGMIAGFTLGTEMEVQAEGYAEGILMGALDAPGAGEPGTPRTYDFGPGVGSDIAVSLQYRHFPVLSARYHWSLVHSVSGSPANHFTQLPSIEAALPLTRVLGVGAYAGWYVRRSSYAGGTTESNTFRELRVYLVAGSRPRPATPAPQ